MMETIVSIALGICLLFIGINIGLLYAADTYDKCLKALKDAKKTHQEISDKLDAIRRLQK